MIDAQPTTNLVVSPPMTWQEICAHYPDEWVAIVDADWTNDTDFEFATARVVAHGKTRREPLLEARAVSVQYPSMGHFFTGRRRAQIPPMLVL